MTTDRYSAAHLIPQIKALAPHLKDYKVWGLITMFEGIVHSGASRTREDLTNLVEDSYRMEAVHPDKRIAIAALLHTEAGL